MKFMEFWKILKFLENVDRECKAANFLFSVNLEFSCTFLIVGVLLNILGENQIDIHKLSFL
jgi:hypothetical protein